MRERHVRMLINISGPCCCLLLSEQLLVVLVCLSMTVWISPRTRIWVMLWADCSYCPIVGTIQQFVCQHHKLILIGDQDRGQKIYTLRGRREVIKQMLPSWSGITGSAQTQFFTSVFPPKSVLLISADLVDVYNGAEDKAEQKDVFHLFLFIVAFIAIILS